NEAKVSLKIFNSLGKEIKELVNKEKVKGQYVTIWDGRDNAGGLVKSGTYFAKLVVGGRAMTSKMVLVR
ncbi:MAG: T9SS type A sorting domain-containing protein, partial [Candidatus Omnitrophica bacterium]|nr:T9SS type A sorting domain-containing protein [Candidatus Omnitrophota bacterium]